MSRPGFPDTQSSQDQRDAGWRRQCVISDGTGLRLSASWGQTKGSGFIPIQRLGKLSNLRQHWGVQLVLRVRWRGGEIKWDGSTLTARFC
jgi:hypothetical protein